MRIMIDSSEWGALNKDVAQLKEDVAGVAKVYTGNFKIESTDWSNNEVELENDLFVSGNIIFVGADESEGRENFEAIQDAKLFVTASEGVLTISASEAPSEDIAISVMVIVNGKPLPEGE